MCGWILIIISGEEVFGIEVTLVALSTLSESLAEEMQCLSTQIIYQEIAYRYYNMCCRWLVFAAVPQVWPKCVPAHEANFQYLFSFDLPVVTLTTIRMNCPWMKTD